MSPAAGSARLFLPPAATSPASGTKTARKLGADEVKTTYDRLGRKVTVTDQRGVVHTYMYDSAGRLASDAATTVPSGVDTYVRCITYRYYGSEQTVTSLTRDGSTAIVTLANHGYTTGNLVQISGAEQAAYNGSFTITEVDDNTFTYTVSGSPAYPATGTIKAKRLDSATGRLEAVTSWENADGTGDIRSQVKFWYDGWGNVSRSYQSHSGTVDDDGQGEDTPCVQYAYADGASGGEAKYVRLSSVTYPNGRVVTYHYDGADGLNDILSRLSRIADEDDETTYAAYTYLGAGTIVAVSHPAVGEGDGLVLNYDFDPQNPHTYPGWDRFGRVVDQTWTVDDSPVDSYTYTYDPNSNRTSRTNAMKTDHSLDETYAYDGLDRLLDTDRGGSAFQDWTLDALGNWNHFDGPSLSQDRTHDAANQINDIDGGSWIDPTYDAAGNMISGPKPGAETTEQKYVYDAWNRLVQATAADDTLIGEYRYDGQGRRLFKIVRKVAGQTVTYDRTDYYYNEAWQVLEERQDPAFESLGSYDPASGARGTVSTDVKCQYVWDVRYVDTPVLRDENKDPTVDDDCAESGDERLYYTHDANMNVTALVNTDGTVAERYVYDAYGEATVYDDDWSTTVAWDDSKKNEVLYCGYRFDPETGLDHVRYRYYHPTLGRWIARDPRGYGEAMSLYPYVSGDPCGQVDAYGLHELRTPQVDASAQLARINEVERAKHRDLTDGFTVVLTNTVSIRGNYNQETHCCIQYGYAEIATAIRSDLPTESDLLGAVDLRNYSEMAQQLRAPILYENQGKKARIRPGMNTREAATAHEQTHYEQDLVHLKNAFTRIEGQLGAHEGNKVANKGVCDQLAAKNTPDFRRAYKAVKDAIWHGEKQNWNQHLGEEEDEAYAVSKRILAETAGKVEYKGKVLEEFSLRSR